MASILRDSRDHLRSCREGYFEHLIFATGVGARMAGAGLACMVHGILPGAFMTTGSRTINALATTLGRRGRQEESVSAGGIRR